MGSEWPEWDTRWDTEEHACVQVASAISKEKKVKIVANLTEKLNDSIMCYGMSYEGISVCFLPVGKGWRASEGVASCFVSRGASLRFPISVPVGTCLEAILNTKHTQAATYCSHSSVTTNDPGSSPGHEGGASALLPT